MATREEFAQISGRVYARTRANTMYIPEGWSEVTWLRDDWITGFSAGVYTNGTEIVIGFTGTNEGQIADFVFGNIAAVSGLRSPQVLQAAMLVLQVMEYARSNNLPAQISFTGHSLGGGLASVMAVLFNKQATVFDPAPFEATARSLSLSATLLELAGAAGFSNAELIDYVFGLGLSFPERERNVQSWYVAGEVLESIRTVGNTIADPARHQPLPVGSPSFLHTSDVAAYLEGRINLHSISLLHALCVSAQFQEAVAAQRFALEVFFDTRLYAQDPAKSNKPDFLTSLLRQHIGNGSLAPSNHVLEILAADMLRMGNTGTASGENINKALLAALTEHYQFASQPSALFRTQSGGIHFEIADLYPGASDNKALPRLTSAVWSLSPRDQDALASIKKGTAWHVQSGDGAMTWSDSVGSEDVVIGGAGGDSLQGGAGNDIILGLDGTDTLDGGAGSDTLIGGAGFDTYFVGNGRDRVRDDLAGEGVVTMASGIALSGGKGAGKRNTWMGQNGEVYTFVQTRAAQTGTLTISNLGAGNDVSIEHFDLAQAQSGGYLGIKLDPASEVFIKEGGGTTPFGPFAFNPSTITGHSTIAEGAGRAFTIYLSVAARAGDTLTLRLSGLGDAFQAVLGDTKVSADGAVIELTEGQTQVTFGLVQSGDVTADASGSLSASYVSGTTTVNSNAWTVDLDDAGVTTLMLNGDQSYATYNATTDIRRGDRVVVNRGEVAYVIGADGNLVPGAGAAIVDNTLYGSNGNDTINGLAGNDALNGGGGNDQLDGGDGDDLMAGGGGNNELSGGAGNDFILGAGNLASGLQQLGPNDTWQAPVAKLVYGHGTTWGVYNDSDVLTIWDGATDSGAGSAANAIDAGAGDDHVIAGSGDDHVQGGGGDDWLDGTAGADIIEGGDGNDRIQADGVIVDGFLNTVAAANHGADFVDGGAGDDTLEGGGNADALFGGDGADRIFGDRGGRTDDPYFVGLEIHGADYIDGEDGDDYLEGGGSDDTLYGGAGDDTMWGDTSAANIVGNGAGQGAADLAALAYGNDYLDGEDGNDTIVGGGKDDTLYGGTGNDLLWGDEGNAALRGEDNGVDYLDGGAGDDQLVGGGNDDTLAGGDGADKLLGDAGTDKVAGEFHGADYLDGGAGNDQLVGGGNDDTLLGGDGEDQLTGDFGSSSDPAGEFDGSDYLDGGNGDDLLFGGGGADTLVGGQGNDSLDGGAGADHLEGGAGADIYVVDDAGDFVVESADEGDDAIISSVSIFLPDHVERLTLTGTAGTEATGNDQDNTFFGSDGANRLVGMGGNDTLVGRGGADTLEGGRGDDVYSIDEAGDTVVELEGQGDDFVSTTVSWTLPEHVERLAADGAADIALTGNALDNGVFGNAGNNVLSGRTGDDYLRGGAGNDTYVFNRGDGQDTVDNVDVAGAVDTLRFGAGIADTDVVAFRSGDNAYIKLKGATDAVALLDYYTPSTVTSGVVSDHRIDRIEFANGVVWDQLLIQAAVDRAAANRAPTVNSGPPGLSARAGEAFTCTIPLDAITDPDAGDTIIYSAKLGDGSALPAWLSFDPATRTFTGTPDASDVGLQQLILWGSDDYGRAAGVYVGLNVDPPNRAPALAVPLPDQTLLQGAAFTFAVRSDAFVDPDAGPDAASILSYTATLADGGALPPWLTFDPASRTFSGTAPSPGVTSVRVTATDPGHLRASDVFDIAVQSGLVVNGTSAGEFLGGSPGDDLLTGQGGNDTLSAYAGNDRLDGGIGNDTLTGGAGSDRLDGGAGADKMSGGADDDTYVVDSAKDVVVENADEGIDAVEAGVTYTLPVNVEHLTLTGTAAVSGTGNAQSNLLRGNGAANTLNGGAGNDILEGGAGNDTLTDTAGTALFNGGAGTDALSGGAGAQMFLGGQGDDTLTTGAGNDIVLFNKGDGQDVLAAGDSGQDTLSVGGGIRYADLTLSKVSNDLVLTLGAGDQITFRNWYAKKPSRSIVNLQMIAAAMSDYAPGGSDPLHDNKVEIYNFGALVTAFDKARAANASLTSWALTNALASSQLSGSDSAALGGDLAYQYGLNGTLAGIGMAPALDILANPAFGSSSQPLTPLPGLQVGMPRLS